jgi:signal transduction histidine kinase
MGLFSMRERVGLVNGTLTLVSAPGKGTRVVATVPLTELGEGERR